MHINNQIPYWRLSGLYFSYFVIAGIYLPYWSVFLREIGFDAKAIGWLSMVAVLPKIFSPYLWGWVVDHTGRQIQVIRWSAWLSLCLFCGVLFYQDFLSITLIILLFSICWSGALPQVEAVTFSHLGEASHTYPFVRVWGSVGFIIAVWALGVVFSYISIRYVPSILLVSIMAFWIISLFLRDLPVNDDIKPNTLPRLVLSPQAIVLFVACFLMLVSHAPYYTFYSVYLIEAGYSSQFIGQMWALGVIAEVVLFLYLRHLLKISNLKWLFFSSFILASLRWLLIGCFSESLSCLILAQILHCATFGIYHVVAIQYINRFFIGHLQGRGQGLYSGIGFGAGLAFGSLLTGLLWDVVGGQMVFMLAAIITLMASMLVIYGLEK